MGKGKGGGGGSAPEVQIPAGTYQGAQSESNLGSYATSLLNPLASMTNWAANLASGGRAQQIGSVQANATQTGPEQWFTHNGYTGYFYSSFDPTTGMVTFTDARHPQKQFQTGIQDAISKGYIGQPYGDQWLSDYNQHLKQGQSTAQPGNAASTSSLVSQLGPFLGQAWQAIQQQQDVTKEMPGLQAETAQFTKEQEGRATQLYNQGESLYGQGLSELGMGESMLNQATRGSGLFPSQARYIEETKQQGETEEAATLANMGLSRSTMAPALKEQADLAADATAGQLVQGNIAAAQEQEKVGQGTISAAQQQINLSQASSKLALAGQEMSLAEQTALSGELAQIAGESADIQKTLWQEALSGYGMLGEIIKTASQSYGYSLQGYASVIQGESNQAQAQVSRDNAQAQADQQSTSSMFGAIGQLFGSSGGGGGGSSGGSVLSTIGSIIGIVASFL